MLTQLFQLAGAALILVAYALAETGRTTMASRPFLLANLVGSAILAGFALAALNLGVLFLEGCWAAISARGLVRSLLAGKPALTPPGHVG